MSNPKGTGQMSSLEIHEANKQGLKQVDNALDVLEMATSKIVKNADNIGNELKDQTQMIKGMNDKMDKTDEKIVKANTKLVEVQRTASTTTSWYLMIALIILAVVLIIF